MEHYIQQLISDIEFAAANASFPVMNHDDDVLFWISQEEEEATAPVRALEEWTGIRKEQLPPAEMLSDDQVHRLLESLKAMLHAYNWGFVLQIEVPERIQYAGLRDNFSQDAKVKQFHYGFFELCRPGTVHGKCAFGEYCNCLFFDELFSRFEDEDLTPEEERARDLANEIHYLQKKHGDEWTKYYPYHLDPEYDDENGKPYNYGFGDGNDEEEDEDNWWRK